MNTDWLTVLIFYAWLLIGLFTVKLLKNRKKTNPYQVFLSFFIGPFGLGWLWIQDNRDKIRSLFQSRKSTTAENTDYLNLVFLDNHGRDLFAGQADNSDDRYMITLGFGILLAYSCLFFRNVFLVFRKSCCGFLNLWDQISG